MTTEEIEFHPGRQRGSSQTVIESSDSAKEQRTTAKYGKALFKQRLATIAWWMLPVPILTGRYLVAVVSLVILWRFLRPPDAKRLSDGLIRVAWVVLGACAVAGIIALGALERAWYPVWWEWYDGLMPLTIGTWTIPLPAWFVWPRAFLIIAPPLAWDASYRFVAWRFLVEIVQPTASSTPVQQMRASSVQHPRGSPVAPVDPDEEPPQQVTVNPVKPVPFQAPSNGHMVLDVLQSPTGKQIGQDKVLDMLEAQGNGAGGFGWRVWHNSGWTRTEWEAAMEILEGMGLVTPRQSGQTTHLVGNVDDALEAVERLV